MIQITTSGNNAHILDINSGVTTVLRAQDLKFVKGIRDSLVVIDKNDPKIELFRDALGNFQVNGTTLTAGNWVSVADGINFNELSRDPDEMDVSSNEVIYNGWKIVDSESYNIQKIIFSDILISRKYAIGAWEDRTTLTYE